jgi:hypothetical protein
MRLYCTRRPDVNAGRGTRRCIDRAGVQVDRLWLQNTPWIFAGEMAQKFQSITARLFRRRLASRRQGSFGTGIHGFMRNNFHPELGADYQSGFGLHYIGLLHLSA